MFRSFFKQKCQTFAGSILSVRICCISLSFMTNIESLGFGLLVWQKKPSEDVHKDCEIMMCIFYLFGFLLINLQVIRFLFIYFFIRAFEDEAKARLGLVECAKHELLQPFSVLHEKEGECLSYISDRKSVV